MNFRTLGLLTIVAPFLCIVGTGCSENAIPLDETTVVTADRPALTNVFKVGPTIDLLNRIELSRDVVRGDFRWDHGSLLFSGQQSQANIPVEVPEQYELLMTVARTKGAESLNLGIHFNGVTTTVVIEGWQRRISALNLVDGKIGLNSDTKTSFPVFKDEQPKTIRVVVRRESILVDVDGSVFIDYRDAPTRLGFDERFFRRPEKDQLMIAGWNSTFRVSSFVLSPLGDEPVSYSEEGTPSTAKFEQPGERNVVDSPLEPSSADKPKVDSGMSTAGASDVKAANPNAAMGLIAGSVGVDEERNSEPGNEVPGTNASGTDPVPASSLSSPKVTTPKVSWTATADPASLAQVQLDDHPIRIEMKNGAALLPLGRSPFFCTIEIEAGVNHYHLHDLRKGTKVGKPLSLSAKNRSVSQLADSGEYLLTYTDGANGRQLEVYSFVSGELVLTVEGPEERISDVRRDWLVPGGKLLSIRKGDGGTDFRVRSIPAGEVVAQWNADLDLRRLDAFSVSPGGIYGVVGYDRQLMVFSLADGKIVGEVGFPDGVDEILGMAFNTPADELALVAAYEEKPSSILWCLDWLTGSTTLLEDTGFKLDSLHRVYQLGPALEWVPGDELLLFFGRDLIDRSTGRFFYRIPENVYWQMPRRLLSPTTSLAMMRSGDPQLREYRTVKLDREVMSEAFKVIRQGGLASDIGLPPLSPSIITESQAILAPPDLEPPFSVQTQPIEALERSNLKLPIQLNRFVDIESTLKRIHVVGGSAPVAVAHVFIRGTRADESQDYVVRYDLRRGQQTSSLPIRSDYHLVDVSPSGKHALIGRANEVHSFSRLDIVDLEDSKHVSGWYPYKDQAYSENVDERGQPAALDPQTASWARFIDDDHAVTVNPDGRLIVWSLSNGTARFVCPNFGRPFDVSFDRRYACGSDGARVSVIDLVNGDYAGLYVADPLPQNVLRAAFSPDGRELAAVLGYQGRRVIQFWDTTSGRTLGQFELPFVAVSPGWDAYKQPSHRRIGLEYKRDGFLLLDDLYLIDRKRQSVTWSYGIRTGKHVVAADDQNEWFVQQVGSSGAQGQYWDWKLGALPVPSDDVIAKSARAGQGSRDLPAGRSILSLEGEQLAE